MLMPTVPLEIQLKDEEFKWKRIENQCKMLKEDCWRTDAIPANTIVAIRLKGNHVVFIEFGVDKRIDEVVESPLVALGWFPIE